MTRHISITKEQLASLMVLAKVTLNKTRYDKFELSKLVGLHSDECSTLTKLVSSILLPMSINLQGTLDVLNTYEIDLEGIPEEIISDVEFEDIEERNNLIYPI